MGELLVTLFGEAGGESLNPLQMSLRGLVNFFITLVLLRVAGMRSVGRNTAFDITVVILIGAVLARSVTGEAHFWGTVAASTTVAVVKRLLAQLTVRGGALEKLLKGERRTLCERGNVNWAAMRRSGLSITDLLSGLRSAAHTEKLDAVESISIEPNGDITVVKYAG